MNNSSFDDKVNLDVFNTLTKELTNKINTFDTLLLGPSGTRTHKEVIELIEFVNNKYIRSVVYTITYNSFLLDIFCTLNEKSYLMEFDFRDNKLSFDGIDINNLTEVTIPKRKSVNDICEDLISWIEMVSLLINGLELHDTISIALEK